MPASTPVLNPKNQYVKSVETFIIYDNTHNDFEFCHLFILKWLG